MERTQIDNSIAADRLIAAHDGDVALLYIYIRRTGCRDLEQAARELCRTMQELRAAEEKLLRMGLLETASTTAQSAAESPAPAKGEHFLPPADELPSYTAQDITRLAAADPAFAEIRTEAAQVKGRQLSSSELGVLAGIYDYLALPAEVIMMLLHYCLEQAEARHPGGRPSIRMIQQEAFRWANLELLTLDQAEEYIRRQRDRSSAVGRVQALLGLQGRSLTAPERKNINAWLDMGFDEEVINLAFERTVYNTGSLKWPYMNKILTRWHQAGLHDRKAVEEKDTRRSSAAAKSVPAADKTAPIDLDRLKRLLNDI